MKKELVSRIVSGLLGGIVICYLITIGISISLGDGNIYPCVPSLINCSDHIECSSRCWICCKFSYMGKR